MLRVDSTRPLPELPSAHAVRLGGGFAFSDLVDRRLIWFGATGHLTARPARGGHPR